MEKTIRRKIIALSKETAILLSAVVAAVVLPQIVHGIGVLAGVGGMLGQILLPMYIPVFVISFYRGTVSGVLTGFLAPLVSFLITGMPATTVLNTAGSYVNNLFPFPTEVIISNEVATGDAVLCLLDEYFLGVGGSKNGVVEYSDEYKFIEDQRAFKIKQYAAGRAFDNTSALYLDINGVKPAYITVESTEVTA